MVSGPDLPLPPGGNPATAYPPFSRFSYLPTVSNPAPDPYIDSAEKLECLISSLPVGENVKVAIDTEADSLHSYKEKLCLVQLACGETKVLIDPLAITDLLPLMDWLDKVQVWMHGADFDMTLMRRTFDRIPPRILDTQVAARLCGVKQFGLAYLVESVFGVTLSKQSQRADWGKRPLSQKMIDYALNDVLYVVELGDGYVKRLRELGREAWFLESCDDARRSVLDRSAPDPDEMWRISGSGKLRPGGLNFLRSLWHWRDREAARMDRPAFKVLNNDDLLRHSEALEGGGSARLPDRFPSAVVRRFEKAIRDARETPEADWPRRPKARRRERNPAAEKRFEELKAHRDKTGAELDIDAALLGSRYVLEEIAFDETVAPKLLMKWQLDLMGLA